MNKTERRNAFRPLVWFSAAFILLMALSLVAWRVPGSDLTSKDPLKPQPMPMTTASAHTFEKAIVNAILEGSVPDSGVIVESPVLSGHFTAPEADERMALVYIGPMNWRRWIIIGQRDGEWRLRGEGWNVGEVSKFPGWGEPQLLDFDGDGRQEMAVPLRSMKSGWLDEVVFVYRWNGSTLDQVWAVETFEDNTQATQQDAPLPYRYAYQATWQWADLDGDGLNDIQLDYTATFYPEAKSGTGADRAMTLGIEQGREQFHWDGTAFRPFAPQGPADTFTYIASSQVWLWKDGKAAPLTTSPRGDWEFTWSPDGRWLAWRSQDSASIEIYDRVNDEQIHQVADGGKPATMMWTPRDKLAYNVLNPAGAFLLDPQAGEEIALPMSVLGSWSPDGMRMAYERDGDLHVYDVQSGKDALLVTTGGGEGDLSASQPVWSPRGDYIAFLFRGGESMRVALVPPETEEPLKVSGLTDELDANGPGAIQLAWSRDGSRLAALTGDYTAEELLGGPKPPDRSACLYVLDVSEASGTEWRKVLEIDATQPGMKLAWSPDGSQVTVAAGKDIWNAPLDGEPTRRYRFAWQEPRWSALEWAPDGSGFLVQLAGQSLPARLYWFAADATKPMDLLSDPFLNGARWAPALAGVD